jgi:hypothetical protein
MSHAANATVAIIISLLPLPAIKLLQYLNRGCVTAYAVFFRPRNPRRSLRCDLVFIARSASLKEHPPVLRLIPIALWKLALVPLFL